MTAMIPDESIVLVWTEREGVHYGVSADMSIQVSIAPPEDYTGRIVWSKATGLTEARYTAAGNINDGMGLTARVFKITGYETIALAKAGAQAVALALKIADERRKAD